jgi:flagellar biosynthesis/type III secretory pathway chaperone
MAGRNLSSAFQAAAQNDSRPLPSHPFKIIADTELRNKERQLTANARSLDSTVRRLLDECDDRLSWLQRLKAAIADEEHSVTHQRRACIEVQQITERHRTGVEQLIQRFDRHSRDSFDTFDAQEAALDARAEAVQARVNEIADFLKMLDTRERDATRLGVELSKKDDELDELQRELTRETRELKDMEFDFEDRQRAAERREEAIMLWESRLDRRDAEWHRNVQSRGPVVEVQAIDLDE